MYYRFVLFVLFVLRILKFIVNSVCSVKVVWFIVVQYIVRLGTDIATFGNTEYPGCLLDNDV